MKLLSLFKELNKHPNNVNELKGLILQLAFQGKLTKKWRAVNSIHNGKKEIKALEGLTHNKLSKRDLSDLKEVLDGFNQGSIPENWGVTQLSYVADFWNGKAHEGCVDENGQYVLVNSSFVSTNGKKVKRVNQCFSPLSENDIAIVMSDVPNGRALSRCFLVEEPNKYSLNQRIGGVTPVKGINSNYLTLLLDRNPHYLAVNDGKKQTNLKRIHMISCPIPFPPVEEQKAIVEVVNQLFKEVEQLEELTKERIAVKEDFVTSALNALTTSENTSTEWEFLKGQFSTFFTETSSVKKLRESILQLAVQGKLTAKWRAENPNTEPASELLKRIEAEKNQLIADKKIKKEKSLPQISENEMHYELPKDWVWCRLGNAGYTQTGSTPPKKNPEFYGNYIPFLGPADISNQWMNYPESGLSEKGIAVGRLIPKNSLMMVCIGGSIGKCNLTNVDVSCNQQINTLTPIYNEPIYIKSCCQSPYFQNELISKSTGSATPIINKGKWEVICIPLPPFEEQKAIVQKVKALLSLCDELERQIENSQTQIEQLMQSCLKEVFQ